MMRLDLRDNRLDAGISRDLSGIQLVLEGLEFFLVRIARRRAGLVIRPEGLFFGLEAGIGCESRFTRLLQLRFFRLGQEVHVVMAAGAFTGRWWRRC